MKLRQRYKRLKRDMEFMKNQIFARPTSLIDKSQNNHQTITYTSTFMLEPCEIEAAGEEIILKKLRETLIGDILKHIQITRSEEALTGKLIIKGTIKIVD